MWIVLLIVAVMLVGCNNTIYVDNQDEIVNNSIVFVKNDLSTSLLIKYDDKFSLIELENKDKIYTVPLNVEINNLILIDDVLTDIEYQYKYVLDDVVVLNNMMVKINDKLLVEVNGNNFCVYDNDISDVGDFSMCDFIYILNNEEFVYIKLNNNMKMLFYNEYVNFSSRFLEHLYTTWIDTYIINNNQLVALVINEDDYTVKNIGNSI